MYHPLSTPESPMFTNKKDIVLTYIQELDEVPLESSYSYEDEDKIEDEPVSKRRKITLEAY